MLYFSYGSNMSIRRLQRRVDASRIGVASLHRHRLKFHKYSQNDHSGKCDAEKTGDSEDVVLGVLFEITNQQKSQLDCIEGVGCGYEEKMVAVMFDGKPVKTIIYYATTIDPLLKPLDWYKEHVLIGARENQLPEAYIREIETVESVTDPDPLRHANELVIYR